MKPSSGDSSDSLRTAYDEFLHHHATKANTPPLAARRSMTGIVVVLGLVFLLSGVGGLAWWLQPGEAAAVPSSNTGAHQLTAIALQIEDYRRSTGHLPDSLGTLGLSLPQVEFRILTDGQYELRTSTGHHALIYRAGDTEVRTER